MPLPATPGQTFTAVAVDPTNFAELEYDAKVGAITRVNACGQLIEGYAVSGTESFTSGDPTNPGAASTTTATVSYVVAPQYGAIPVMDHTVENLPTVATDVTSTIDEVPPVGKAP